MTFIPYGRQDIRQEDIDLVSEVLAGDFLTQGPMVAKFEASFAELVGSKHCVAVSNGTAALHTALLSVGVEKGDAVILPANTFAATANAILYCDATPIFVDISFETKCIDADRIEEAIELATSKGLKPKAVIAVHYAGYPAPLEDISKICRKFSMSLIEDACHAPGSSYQTKDGSWHKVGSGDHSDAACFSFHPVKHIAAGEGGCITTSNKDIASKSNLYSKHGITKDPKSFVNLDEAMTSDVVNPWFYEMHELGFNYRLSDIQCALAYSQLQRFSANLERRRSLAKIYYEALINVDSIEPGQKVDSNVSHAYHLFTVDIDFNKIKLSRAKAMELIRKKNVGTQVHYIPIYKFPYYQKNQAKFLKLETPNTESHYNRTLSIPLYHSLDIEDARYAINTIIDAIK